MRPRGGTRDVVPAASDALFYVALGLLRVGVRHAGILTAEPEHLGRKRGAELGRDERFWVCGRRACRGRGGPVEVFSQGGRKVHGCPREQVS